MRLSIPLLALTASLTPMASGVSILPPTKSEITKIENEHNKSSPGPLKFAEPHEVSINLCNEGEWVGNTWNLYIESPGAKNLNFGFKKVDLPNGAKMRIKSAEKDSNTAEIKVDKSNVHTNGQFWTPVLDTDRVNISIDYPKSLSSRPPCEDIDLGFINVGFRSFSGDKSGSCNVDVVCPERTGWEKEIKSVAGVSWGGSLFCTGSMINNMNQDETPYFLTAHHCGLRSNNAASLVTYWNFETSTCGGNPDGILNQATTGGATVIAGNSESDVTLLKLNNSPDPSYGVTFAGWDNTPGEYTLPGVCIHHPSGDEKRISFENDPMESTNYGSNTVNPSGTHVKVTDWDKGTTEPGSSGSPLFNGNHRIIGQLHGGAAACGNDSADWYGRFSASWENPAISQALDPNDNLGGGYGGVDTYDPFSHPTMNPAPTESPTEPVPTVSPTECNGGSISLRLSTDNFGSEVNWSLTNEQTNVEVLNGGPHGDNELIEVDECINTGCYKFEIFDSFGDGICCGHGNGYYSIIIEGVVVQESDGMYGPSEMINFCIPTVTPPPNLQTTNPTPNSPTTKPTPNPPTTNPTPNPPTTNPPSNSEPCGPGCCSQNFNDCVSWCGTTESKCLSCNQDVFWINCPGQNCLKRWAECTGNHDGCCDGLTCVNVNPNYSQCRYVENPSTLSPSDSVTPEPTASPIVSDTSSPSRKISFPPSVSLPTADMCIPAGSNCFTKHAEVGCNEKSCEQNVCEEREKCCNKKWNNKCKDKAEELCTPCACDEDIDELFLLKMKESEPITKTCEWLKDQSIEKRDSVCKKFHSFEQIQAARFVCPITCDLEGCIGN